MTKSLVLPWKPIQNNGMEQGPGTKPPQQESPHFQNRCFLSYFSHDFDKVLDKRQFKKLGIILVLSLRIQSMLSEKLRQKHEAAGHMCHTVSIIRSPCFQSGTPAHIQRKPSFSVRPLWKHPHRHPPWGRSLFPRFFQMQPRYNENGRTVGLKNKHWENRIFTFRGLKFDPYLSP